MDERHLHARVRIDDKGRVEIPARLRDALNIRPGEELVLRIKDDRLEIETVEAVEARLLSWFANVAPGVSLVDELLAERREAARREAEE